MKFSDFVALVAKVASLSSLVLGLALGITILLSGGVSVDVKAFRPRIAFGL